MVSSHIPEGYAENCISQDSVSLGPMGTWSQPMTTIGTFSLLTGIQFIHIATTCNSSSREPHVPRPPQPHACIHISIHISLCRPAHMHMNNNINFKQ